MGTFNTRKTLYGSASLIPSIANRIEEEFQNDGYEVTMDALSGGGYDISITKDGMFKAILGMKTALKVTLLPQGRNIIFEAGIGIWGQQVIPTAISMLFFWPIIITQIWSLVEQAQLDDKTLDIAKDVVYMNNNSSSSATSNMCKYCTSCGTQNTESANFCCGCGKPL